MRPDTCPDCGASCRAHTGTYTGTYCHECGAVFVVSEPPVAELTGYAGLTVAVRELVENAQLVDDPGGGDRGYYGYLVSVDALNKLRELVA